MYSQMSVGATQELLHEFNTNGTIIMIAHYFIGLILTLLLLTSFVLHIIGLLTRSIIDFVALLREAISYY